MTVGLESLPLTPIFPDGSGQWALKRPLFPPPPSSPPAFLNLLNQPSKPLWRERTSSPRYNDLICRAPFQSKSVRQGRSRHDSNTMHGHTRTGSEGERGRLLLRARASHAQAQINTRNHTGDNRRRFIAPDSHPAIITFSKSHNQGRGGWRQRVHMWKRKEGTEHGSLQVHEMCEYVREMNWNGCESASICRRMHMHIPLYACVCVFACAWVNFRCVRVRQMRYIPPFFFWSVYVYICVTVYEVCMCDGCYQNDTIPLPLSCSPRGSVELHQFQMKINERQWPLLPGSRFNEEKEQRGREEKERTEVVEEGREDGEKARGEIGKWGWDWPELATTEPRERERERETNGKERRGWWWMEGLCLSLMRWPITVGARSDALQVERTLFWVAREYPSILHLHWEEKSLHSVQLRAALGGLLCDSIEHYTFVDLGWTIQGFFFLPRIFKDYTLPWGIFFFYFPSLLNP